MCNCRRRVLSPDIPANEIQKLNERLNMVAAETMTLAERRQSSFERFANRIESVSCSCGRRHPFGVEDYIVGTRRCLVQNLASLIVE